MYKVTSKYCLSDQEDQVVKVYFINEIPFTYDTVDDIISKDEKVMNEAIMNPSISLELIAQKSDYLIKENLHPLLSDVTLHPESVLPDTF